MSPANEDRPSLYEFMPYGAPELMEVAKRYMFRATVTGSLVRAYVTQDFENPSGLWVEGLYAFPLSATAAVDESTYRWGDDGLGGICDRYQLLCFAPTLWNAAGSRRQRLATDVSSMRP